MQYGNPFFGRMFVWLRPRLNRTMQYGNLRHARTLLRRRPGLNRTMQYGNGYNLSDYDPASLTFKSYYVVWKQERISKVDGTNPCLNRTMQYGNLLYLFHLLFVSLPGLNRTMQYGNLRGNCTHARPYVCLNRTMQYGNTVGVPITITSLMFKSYYVVWKLFGFFTMNLKSAVFKSYYVVWKQKSSKAAFHSSALFKSYYVVWKLEQVSPELWILSRLNRTMQYGNFDARTESFPFFGFKSYYVVWKLSKKPQNIKYRRCLNRTMQYGNFFLFFLVGRVNNV